MNGLREHEHRSKIKPTDDEQVDCSANESRDKETYDRTSDSLQLLMHQGNTPVQETNSLIKTCLESMTKNKCTVRHKYN